MWKATTAQITSSFEEYAGNTKMSKKKAAPAFAETAV